MKKKVLNLKVILFFCIFVGMVSFIIYKIAYYIGVFDSQNNL